MNLWFISLRAGVYSKQEKQANENKNQKNAIEYTFYPQAFKFQFDPVDGNEKRPIFTVNLNFLSRLKL